MAANTNVHGRVDDENNVYVTDNGTERKVGQYPGVPAADALAYFERKYADLEAQVRILEQRVANKADAHTVKKNLSTVKKELVEPAAVGDIQALRLRVQELEAKVSGLVAEKHAMSQEQIAQALAERVKIAEAAEKIANQDPSKVQWKTSSAEMAKLFEQWQASQKSGPKLPKSEADPVWRRFSSARTSFEAAKRQYFAGLDAVNKSAKAKKLAIVEAAEKLPIDGTDSLAEYRKLLDSWKAAGRGSGKGDDQLWARFKTAGDAIYAAKSSQIAAENLEFEANYKLKLELVAEAERSIKPETDLAAAKKILADIQARWEKVGKVPREKVREVEDRIKAVESKVRKAEQDHWRKTDPATQDRTNSVLTQLEESIVKLESDLAAAKAKKDTKAIKDATDALDARKAWLKVVQESSK